MLLQSLFFRRFLAVCLFFSYHTATAQSKLELKANLLPILLESRAELSGEYLVSERIGIEAGIGYGWGTSKSGYRDTTSMSGGTIWTEIRQFREANYYLSGRYYFAPKQGGDRFLMGALMEYRHFTSYTLNGVELERPEAELHIGVEPGYKWVLNKRFIIEIGTRALFMLGERGLGSGFIDLGFAYNSKIGYRF